MRCGNFHPRTLIARKLLGLREYRRRKKIQEDIEIGIRFSELGHIVFLSHFSNLTFSPGTYTRCSSIIIFDINPLMPGGNKKVTYT